MGRLRINWSPGHQVWKIYMQLRPKDGFRKKAEAPCLVVGESSYPKGSKGYIKCDEVVTYNDEKEAIADFGPRYGLKLERGSKLIATDKGYMWEGTTQKVVYTNTCILTEGGEVYNALQTEIPEEDPT